MALQHINATVGTTATLLFQMPVGVQQSAVQIYNGDSAVIFVGSKTITTTGATIGRAIPAATAVQFLLNSGDVMYGVSLLGGVLGSTVITYSA